MVVYTSLAEIENCRLNGQTGAQVPTLVYVSNFVAANPYPHKFLYISCLAPIPTGQPCGKSLEFSQNCDHSSLPGKPKFRFTLFMEGFCQFMQPYGMLLRCSWIVHLLTLWNVLKMSRLPMFYPWPSNTIGWGCLQSSWSQNSSEVAYLCQCQATNA